uniref:Zinc_ribbon_16 domain-containing protein n=1 Tax=Rhodnius prolixus TaxID=13249 RepID=T1HA87_RHOPR
MNSGRLEVQWSPCNPDKFITWGSDIYLYETLPKQDIKEGTQYVDISDTTVAYLLASNSGYHYAKCVDIYPNDEMDTLLAVGQANGKVTLVTFGPTKYDSLGLTGLEFNPKHARPCNAVAWSPSPEQLLACGLDRYRNDHCVHVWDVGSRQPIASPVAELGLSDTANSICWLHNRCLVVGVNSKQLKMYDLRDPTRAINSSQTKAVFGVTGPPRSSYLFASYVENQIAIWDIRSLDKPVLTLPQAKPVIKISWCPTRKNLLGSLHKDSRSLHLHDIQLMDDMDHSILERSVKTTLSNQITSFSWHPKRESRLLAISLAGVLCDYYVCERMTLNWSQTCEVVWTYGQRDLKIINESNPIYEELGDISRIMRRRALQGYGLKTELKDNAVLVDDEDLKDIWYWLDQSKDLVNDGTLTSSPNKLHPGIKSEVRDKALYLCNWKFVHDPITLQLTMEQLESQGFTTKAAALAVFSLQLKLAIKLLAKTEYNTLAMALSGFNDDKNSIWRESCMVSRMKLTDPYLRAVFAFLTSDSENYDLVVHEQEMAVADRVGFALTYLSDTKLAEFITQLTDSLVQEGNLSAVLLTGMSTQTISLLQHYLDNTGDVQSVSALAMRGFSPTLLEHDRTQYWINSYRELLDIWRMWSQRSQFDIWYNSRSSTKPEQQVYVNCNFCGKSTSAHSQIMSRTKASYPRFTGSSNQNKMSCCPNCRKPQPRCAICLIHMGTASCYQPENVNQPTVRINPFDLWYTWCQTCRHGGHAMHITQWFKEHQECPVTACTCKCFSLDAPSNIPSVSSVT